jgi:hypothetical protein
MTDEFCPDESTCLICGASVPSGELFHVCETSPGPAFIPWNSRKDNWPEDLQEQWRQNVAPYVWQDWTEGTMAGWVRRRGSQPLAEGGAVGRSALAER